MRIGISVERWWHLHTNDSRFRAWAASITPAVFRCRELQAINEGLTVWRCDTYMATSILKRMLPFDDVPTFHKYVHTPPARPEWLEVLP